MNKKIIMNFFKDYLPMTLIYFAAMVMIVLFYQFTTNHEAEIIYPVLIAVYMYVIWMVIEGVRYFKFHKRLNNSVDNPGYDLRPSNKAQKEISEIVSQIHKKYITSIHTIQIENNTRQRFLSQWIHHLKTPISVIDLTTQKQIDNLCEAKEMLESISEENRKLYDNVDQLLNIIRLDEFSKDLDPQAIDLSEELKVIINGLKNQFIKNNVFPKLNIEVNNPVVFSDVKWHRIMIEQFLTNAIKYTQATDTTKYVEITLQKEETGYCLTVKDEGIGIAEHDLSRIFEPFFTGDNGRKVKTATGIGLYIARTIADKLSHRIEVISRVSEGTSVMVHYNVSFEKINLSRL